MKITELLAGAALALVLSIGALAPANPGHSISAGITPQAEIVGVSHGSKLTRSEGDHARTILAETEVEVRPHAA